MLIWMIFLILSSLLLLIGVAFITLLERKFLGLSQIRISPNKILMKGVLQPVIDGVKLLAKSVLLPFRLPILLFLISPVGVIICMVIIWGSLENVLFISTPWWSFFFLLATFGLGVYWVFLSGWASSSKYSFIGAMRATTQTLSYEVMFVLLMVSFIISFPSCMLFTVSSFMIMVLPAWILCSLAEANRAPYDFAEGESELISGFNIEFMGAPFALIFVGEYGMVMFLSWLSSAFFFGVSFLGAFLIMMIFLFIRSVLPRFRYDKLMAACWAHLLPMTIFVICVAVCMTSI